MTDRDTLKKLLQNLVKALEADLKDRAKSHTPTRDQLKADHKAAVAADRTGDTFATWLGLEAAQLAVAWVLSCVFVRFLEDNTLIDPVLAGPGHGAPGTPSAAANDHRDAWFSKFPTNNDRQYLLHLFDELAENTAVAALFGPHNPLRQRPEWLSADAAQDHLVKFFRSVDPDTGELVASFDVRSADHASLEHPPALDTRFLGDLYQDLSEATRKRYALLQTPDFVEDFIFDRTLTPALETFGLTPPPVPGVDRAGEPPALRLIDPACGSGHFLLGAFARILAAWQTKAPALSAAEHVVATLRSIHGVDLNPYAVAIARFRLLLAAMHAAGVTKLAKCPDFELQLACGDSLLHGDIPKLTGVQLEMDPADANHTHIYATEDRELLIRLLRRGRYHAVVGNPPYITVKDKQQNANIRASYGSCYRSYALSVPFMERIFHLAVAGGDGQSAGFTGQITANSFMKREFGKKLIEEFIPRWQLTHVVDTSGAYIPGHGTPTVILFGRPRPDGQARADTIRTVMGIRGEPSTPADPQQGKVWSAILSQIDEPGSESGFVSVGDTDRKQFESHPWSIGGGGAAELKERLEEATDDKLEDLVTEIGFGAVTREDDAYLIGTEVARRLGVSPRFIRPLVSGDEVRDWMFAGLTGAIWPYSPEELTVEASEGVSKALWPMKTQLSDRVAYGLTQLGRGLEWFEYSMFFHNRFRTPLSITFAEVATHNHFVLDRGGKVFKQTAPVIKLHSDDDEFVHIELTAILNSSTVCFLLKQVCMKRAGGGIGRGLTPEAYEARFAFDGSKVGSLPLPSDAGLTQWFEAANRAAMELPQRLVNRAGEVVDANEYASICTDLYVAQEEVDWEVYSQYGLLEDESLLTAVAGVDVPDLRRGERAFEIILARQIAAGEIDTTWFTRHNATPITEPPDHWPGDYKALVNRRIAAIEANPKTLGLIEQPEYKRRWNQKAWDDQVKGALHAWLLTRLEAYFDLDGRMQDDADGPGTAPGPHCKYPTPELLIPASVAQHAAADPAFREVAALYTGDAACDIDALVATLMAKESVPAVAAARYKPAGLTKHADWLHTWDLQREEDAIDADDDLDDDAKTAAKKSAGLDKIPVPPKYKSSDFLSTDFWRLRGKLDVPKERWASFPLPDGATLYAWAGLDHQQLATACARTYGESKNRGGEPPRVLLVAILELLPWIKQWHPDADPGQEASWGDLLDTFLATEALELGVTLDDLSNWTPPPKPKRGRKKKG